jgi:multiple antibiotic resistance protein
MMMSAAADTFLYSLVALLVIIDPVGTAVLFAGMTPGDPAAERARQAKRACVIAFLVLAVFGVGGQELLSALGIGLAAMKVAGGALLFLTAADMVTAHGALRSSEQEREAAVRTQDISVFPLAIPLIAGPGAMTTMVLLQSQAGGCVLPILAIQLALAVAVTVTLVALVMARYLSRRLGQTGSHVVGRVLGVLLAALAAQLVLDGVREGLGLR